MRFFLPYAVAMLGLLSCKSEDSAQLAPLEPLSPLPQTSAEADKASELDKVKADDGKAHISQATMDVFGIKLPPGMAPTKGPYKVYRFEGTYHVSHLVNHVGDQVSDEKVEPEGDGFLMRHAKIVGPDGLQDLAIRIFPGSGGGSVIDIWQEHEHVSELPSRAPSIYKSSQKSDYFKRGKRISYKERQQRDTREMLRAIKKMRSKKRLDEGDMQNPFFNDE